jgi:phage shock protein PspC (stress-responsive transcriptional regulator)
MTDETPPQTPAEEPAADDTPAQPEPRRLTRSEGDAVIGGVASGLARYFNVDALLFRIGFVALSFVGGIGVLAYLLLLAFVPADGETKPGGTSKAAAVAGAVVLGVALVAFLGTPFFFFGPGLLVLAVVGLAGILLWRAFGGAASDDPARTAGRFFLAALLAIAVAGAALGVGLAAALGGGVVVASLAVVTGLVLIGTAFVGGTRWLIVPALALVLPLGIVAAADIDLDGGIGDREYRPATMGELNDHYEIGIGGIDVDLTDLDLPSGRTNLDIDRRRVRDLGRRDRRRRGGRLRPRLRRRRRLVRRGGVTAGRPAGPAHQRRRGRRRARGRARGLAARPRPPPRRLRDLRRPPGRPVRGRDGMRVRQVDRTSLVAGLVTTVAGLILLLDRLGEIDLDLGYGLPLLIAAVGAILLTAGLEGPRKRS